MSPLIKNLIFRLLRPVLLERGPPGAVYLTFDDGPHPECTPKVLSALARHNAKATFFMVGTEMEKYPDLVATVARQGHAIGYHSYAHQRLTNISMRDMLADLRHMDVVMSGTGKRPALYRPPYGTLSVVAMLIHFVRRKKIVMWSLDSRDAFAANAAAVLEKIQAAKIKDGEILLFHDDSAITAEALPAILEHLGATGHRCAPLPR